MPTVVGLLALLAGGIGALITTLVTSAKNTGDLLHRRQTFYTCDGFSRSVRALAQQYFQSTAAPTPDDLEAFVYEKGGAGLSSLLPEGYTLQTLTLTTDAELSSGVIPNGPFKDMNASLADLKIYLRAKGPEGHVCANQQSLTLAQIGLYQFFAFSDGPMHLIEPAPMTVTGRMHANQEFCAGSASSGSLQIDRVTSAGRFLHGQNCTTAPQDGNMFRVVVSTGTVDVTPETDATMSGWADYANTTLEQKVQDESHGVIQLKLPVSAGVSAQNGRNQDGIVHSNQGSLRFVIDPVMPDDDESVRQEKLAWKADIRIINGIWYRNDGTFPGTPIWSDHPGNYITSDEKDGPFVGDGIAAGQYDLGYAVVPHKYSYYEHEVGVGISGPANVGGVVSYGGLGKAGTGWCGSPVVCYKPSFWVDSGQAAPGGIGSRPPLCSFQGDGAARGQLLQYLPYDEFDISPPTPTPNCAFCSDPNVYDGALCPSSSVTAPATRGDFLLEAARSGFIDHRVRLNGNSTGTSVDHAPARILPINFDVFAFADALHTMTNHELGTHFGGDQPFNGIVWIGSYWPNQESGLGGGGVTKWPNQGDLVDNAQIPVASGGWTNPAQRRAQSALPYPLCTDSAPGTMSFTPSMQGGAAVFPVPACEHPSPSHAARPNAVRIYHASQLPPAAFPKGLTIASNLPIYVLGDANQNASANWVPMQVAGDAVTLLSNNWTDGNMVVGGRVDWSSIDNLSSSDTGKRDAIATSYRVAILSGAPRSTAMSSNGDLMNFPRFMEKWTGVPCVLEGAIVDGFNSVFQDQPWKLTGYYRPPNRNWSFDTHLQFVANQPPGAPIFDVSAVRYWKRE